MFNKGVFIALMNVNRGAGSVELATSVDGGEWSTVPSVYDLSGNRPPYISFVVDNKAIIISINEAHTHTFASYDTATQFYVPGQQRPQGFKGYVKAREAVA